MITVEDVRDYVRDVTWEDNDLLLDLAFTDEQIISAMKAVVREWNGIPPYTLDGYTYATLPDNTNVFFDGITAALLRTELINKTRNEADYRAGNMSTTIDTTYIQRLRELIQMFQGRFKEVAQGLKLTDNLEAVYGQIG